MYKKRGRWKGMVLGILTLIAVILAVTYYLISTYSVTNVYVEGNLHYTEAEIKDIVMAGPLGHNSLYLSVKYRNKGVENVPFVDVMDVTILAPDSIRITVYEKALAGYIRFMDSNMYFDRDGYVVETSSVKTVGVPQIIGLNFDHVVLGEKLPVQDAHVFESIMTITKLLDKYMLTVDKIYFPSNTEVMLYFGGIKVDLGEAKKLEEKIMALPTFLDRLEGKQGTLHMEDYIENPNMTVFKEEKNQNAE